MEQHEKNKKALVGIILTITAMIIGLIITSYMDPHASSHKVFGVTYMTRIILFMKSSIMK